MIKALNSWGWDLQRVQPEAKKIGIMVYEYVSPFGTLEFIHHKRTLTGDTYGGYAYVLDKENIGISYMADFGRPHMVDHSGTTSADGIIYEYTADFSLMRKFEDTHGKIIGILG